MLKFSVMGSSETDKPAKEPKTPPPPSTQEQALATGTATVNAEWPGYQAYSPIPPHGFLASSPQPHPYMWGVQHIMPPYGTPHPYMAMYPHGGMYAHPSIPPSSYPFSPFAIAPNGVAEASGNTPASADGNSKPPVGKDKLPIKRSRGSLRSLNMITGKSTEECKTGPSASSACSKSAESASDGSSEESDENSQNDSPVKSGGRQEASEAEACQNGISTQAAQNGVSGAPHALVNHAMPIMAMTAPGALSPVPGPATNLNIGMDYWGSPALSTMPAIRGKVPSAPVAAGIVPAGSRDNLQPQLWLQDEREVKRQRRKQSNRESARRSRLRKQAECDELAQRAESLKEENANLRSELNHFRSKYEKLVAENTALKERLGETTKDLGSSQPDERAVTETQESSKTDEMGMQSNLPKLDLLVSG